MRHAPTTTPLLNILRALGTDERRKEFADAAGTTVPYLYQLGTCKRGACRSLLAKGIADASVQMRALYKTPAITMDQLATLCVGC